MEPATTTPAEDNPHPDLETATTASTEATEEITRLNACRDPYFTAPDITPMPGATITISLHTRPLPISLSNFNSSIYFARIQPATNFAQIADRLVQRRPNYPDHHFIHMGIIFVFDTDFEQHMRNCDSIANSMWACGAKHVMMGTFIGFRSMEAVGLRVEVDEREGLVYVRDVGWPVWTLNHMWD